MAALLGFAPTAPGTAFGVIRAVSIAACASTSALLMWGVAGSVSRRLVRELDVEIDNLSAELDGLRIAHLSDLHIGNGLIGEALDQLVEQVNSLGVDLIAITGDLFDRSPCVVAEGARSLANLRAKHGVWAVLGNHDAYTGTEIVADGLAQHAPDLHLLRLDCESLEPSLPLAIAGVDDPSGQWRGTNAIRTQVDTLATLRPAKTTTILLMHRPDGFARAAQHGFSLMLAGHYHGGQLALPGLGGRLNVARFLTRYDRGLFRHLESALFVSRGVGVTGPRIRVNCIAEIAVLKLRRQEPSSI